ncbi:Glutamate decarboxylase-like protein 1 [Tupaia chinensis]|uniref:Glutamate decarboxylase-like protein 1 n=1 Tax=Tupaia chinensis TaxID=246437 RepID=L9JBK6_TUPCH|nr:Glutamate decarboxylase-like protein 1 [Tupaia chinensis]
MTLDTISNCQLQCPEWCFHALKKGDSDQEEIVPSKKSAILVDGVVLNGPTTDAKAGEKFVEEACRLIMEEVVLKATDVNEKVCEWRPPEQLKQLVDLELRDKGEPHHRLLELCQDVIHYSVKTNHPRFFNQLYAGLDYYALVARFMTEALNPSIYTYEVSPVFLLVEEAILKKMIEFVGWKEGDGIFNPGGSVSNMYAIHLARYKYFPEIKEKGLSGLPRLIFFTSAECHYSMKKAASFLGIGTENVCFVETDGRGRMIPAELEKQIWQARKQLLDYIKANVFIAREGMALVPCCVPAQPSPDTCFLKRLSFTLQDDVEVIMGAAPFLVCATSGTTVLGAFDPLDEIADICERHDLWLHVDASWGGSALMSRKHRTLLHGIHRKYFWFAYKKSKPERFILIAASCAYAQTCYELKSKVQCSPKVAPAIKERMMKKGSLMLGYQPHRGKVNFFRQVVISPQVSREDMDFLLDEIDLLGKDM